MSKKLKKKVPELRFPEFDGNWDTDRIDNFLVRHVDPVDVDLETNYKQIGIRSHGKGIFHKEAVTGRELGNKRVYWVHPNAFVVNIVFAWEQAVALTSSDEDGFIASHRFLMFLPKQNRASLEFVILFFLRERGKYLLELASPGGAGRNKTLGQQNFAELEITLPKIAEQEKIASFFGAVDTRLNQLRHKRELLQTYKRGVMQKIFSQKIRFKQDDGSPFADWERKKLGDLLTIRYGKDHQNLEDGEYPVLGTGGVMRYVNSYLYDKPSILIGRKGTIDQPQFVTYPFWTVDTLFYSEIQTGIVPFFLFLVVLSINWKKYNEATGVPSLNTSSINNIKVIIATDVKEQEKIANFITVIDQKIEALSRQFDQTEQFKKGLLQKMFV